jgi:hypothetical protein
VAFIKENEKDKTEKRKENTPQRKWQGVRKQRERQKNMNIITSPLTACHGPIDNVTKEKEIKLKKNAASLMGIMDAAT